MVMTFAAVLFGLMFLVRPLRRSPFFVLGAALVIGAAWWTETRWFTARPFMPKTFLLFLAYDFVGMNIAAFVAYWADKRAAQRGAWRVPERELHSLEMLGGWTGALLAQKIFRHKTKKKEYQTLFWAILGFQAAAVYFILKYLRIV